MASYSPGEIIAISVVCMILPIVAVALRICAVKFRKAAFAADDYVIFAALISAIFTCGAIIWGSIHGEYGTQQHLGPNGEFVFDQGIQNFWKADYVVQIFSGLTDGLSKISVLLLYLRIFTTKTFRITAYLALTFMIVWTLAFTLVTVLQCVPPEVFWTIPQPFWGSSCIQIIPFYEAQAVTDIITDFGVLILPMPMIFGLHLTFKHKIGVAGMFSLGLLASVFGIVRIVIFFQLGDRYATDVTHLTYFSSPVFIWGAVKAGVTVTSTCLPTYRPLFTRLSKLRVDKHAFLSSYYRSEERKHLKKSGAFQENLYAGADSPPESTKSLSSVVFSGNRGQISTRVQAETTHDHEMAPLENNIVVRNDIKVVNR